MEEKSAMTFEQTMLSYILTAKPGLKRQEEWAYLGSINRQTNKYRKRRKAKHTNDCYMTKV